MMAKSWKWITEYEKARKKYNVTKSKMIANRTIKKRPKRKIDIEEKIRKMAGLK